MPTRKQADRIAELEDRIKVLELRIAALEARQPIVIMPLPPCPQQVPWRPGTPWFPLPGPQYDINKPLFRPDVTSGVN